MHCQRLNARCHAPACRSMVLIHVLAAYQVYSQPVFYLVRSSTASSTH